MSKLLLGVDIGTTSTGAAFVAGMGSGVFKDWGEIDRLIEVRKNTISDKIASRRYQKSFQLYRQLYDVNQPLFDQISSGIFDPKPSN